MDQSTKAMHVKRDHKLVSAALAGTASAALDKARQQADREDRRCSLLRERDHKQLYLDRFESRQKEQQQEAMVVSVFSGFNEADGEGYPDPTTVVPKSHHEIR